MERIPTDDVTPNEDIWYFKQLLLSYPNKTHSTYFESCYETGVAYVEFCYQTRITYIECCQDSAQNLIFYQYTLNYYGTLTYCMYWKLS